MTQQNDYFLVPSEDFLNTIIVCVDPRDADQFIEIGRLSRVVDLLAKPDPKSTENARRLDPVA